MNKKVNNYKPILPPFLPFFLAFLAMLCLIILYAKSCQAGELWKVTYYCSCQRCCGKSDGITASGKLARYGYVACNWLPFGTMLEVKGLGQFMVMDRGAKSLFGSKTNHIKHIDIWLPNHKQALNKGVEWREVRICTNSRR